MEKLLDNHNKYHWIHNIRSQILCSDFFNETLETLDNMCLDELFWVFEQALIKNKYEEVVHKDNELKEKFNN